MTNTMKKYAKVTENQIFADAMFSDSEGGWMLIESVKPGQVYAYGDKFDMNAPSKAKMAERLTENGYYFVGAN